MKKFIIIPIFSYILALWIIYSLEKHSICSIYTILPILIVFLFSYINEWSIRKAKGKFDKWVLALLSASNLALLYNCGSVLFVMLGGNYILAIILLIFGIYDNYRILNILD